MGWMPVTFRVVSLPISHWAGSMQSSFTLLCRVLVMLTCLVVLPLAAITGGTGRKMIVPLVEKCLNLLREPPVEPDGRPSGPRPPLRSSVAAGRPGAAGQQVATGTHGSGPTSGSGRAVYPDRGALNQPREQLGPPPSASDLQPQRQRQAERGSVGASVATTPGRGVAAASGHTIASDRQRDMEQRLKDLGATYYILEKWGNRERLYRFECRMAIASDANYTRFFEATSERPLGAMDSVLRQVEAWRADRHVR
jgi:hypothetical protein